MSEFRYLAHEPCPTVQHVGATVGKPEFRASRQEPPPLAPILRPETGPPPGEDFVEKLLQVGVGFVRTQGAMCVLPTGLGSVRIQRLEYGAQAICRGDGVLYPRGTATARPGDESQLVHASGAGAYAVVNALDVLDALLDVEILFDELTACFPELLDNAQVVAEVRN